MSKKAYEAEGLFCELFELLDESEASDMGSVVYAAWRLGREVSSERSELELDQKPW